MNKIGSYLTSLVALTAFGGPASACSDTTPCTVETGEYFIALPDGADENTPAIMHIHGYGGTAKGAVKNDKIAKPFLEAGYAVIAPQGLTLTGSNITSWSFHPDMEDMRDETAFLKSVRADAVAQHGIDPDRIILTGFSLGGSLVSYVGCEAPDSFAAYAPVSGSFWRPHPEGCNGPVRVLHTHGWTDGTVPLEGRAVRGENMHAPDALVQGDVFFGMQLWRDANGCVHSKADRFDMDGPFWRRAWDRCTPGSDLEFALFPGGHVIPDGWAEMVVEWFEDVGG